MKTQRNIVPQCAGGVTECASVEANMAHTLSALAIIKEFMPVLVVAGDYALRIRDRVESLDDKITPGGTALSAALTAADVSIKNMFEIVTLAAHPS